MRKSKDFAETLVRFFGLSTTRSRVFSRTKKSTNFKDDLAGRAMLELVALEAKT